MNESITNQAKIRIFMIYCCVMMFAFSLSSSMYSSLAPFIITHYGATLTESSLFTISSSIGNLLINLLIIRMADKYNKARLLAVLCFIVSAALIVIGRAPTMAVYLIANCVNGMVGYWIDNLTTAYVSDLYGEQRGRYIGILYTLFAVGSAVAPTFNTIVLEVLGLDWSGSYKISGFFFLMTAISYFIILILVKQPAEEGYQKEEEEVGKLSISEMLRSRNMLALILSGITMAFYGYFSGMLPTYFSFTNPDVYTTALRNFILTCYTVGQMVSRFLYIPLAPRLNPIRYLRFQSLFCTICSLVCLLVDKPVLWMILMFASGVISGSAYTMTIVLTCDEYPDHSSSANAATGFASGIAYLVATPIMNMIADNISFFVAMIIPVFFGFATYFIYQFMYHEKSPGLTLAAKAAKG
ncbi:MAG: MFS transporter [Oscillospiraceae bacterium]|nr:MFS transporter [Oscillospiraceae bacterium]